MHLSFISNTDRKLFKLIVDNLLFSNGFVASL